jgi:hypothetical protein
LTQLRSASTKSTLVIRESTASWPGRLLLGYHPRQDRLEPVSIRRGLKCRTGGRNSITLFGDGRDRLKRSQIIVENGFRRPP